uniref:RNA-directed DNA polymerase n=1 Tax=Tanacetum cinerariifolium TaxID=118510 RepID=A0A699GVG0_TANCI|nr:putative reverse transcriptase domain-containing protein [Tanacetum cinerariifolium]
MTKLTQKKVKFDWGDKQEATFQIIKQKLSSASILALPEGSKDFVVYYDASIKGLGVVLMQREKVIAYGLRQLKVHEKNYTTHDLELGAVVFAMKNWRHYLYGTKCTFFTNHKNLQHILDKKELNMRQRRWLELLSDYDCEIRYHLEKADVVADALSWKERIKPLRVRALVMTIGLVLPRQILEAQMEVSPWKGVVRFGKRGKLNPRYIGPFKVLAKVGTVSYIVKLLEQLSKVYSTFHVSNLKKCLSDVPLEISLDEVHIDDKLCFVEELVEIMDREVKRLKQSCIPIIKVRWNSRKGPEFTWEREDQFRKNQVKDNKIDLLVQQYEQFVISEDESIDSAFARFNTIITSLKALDEGYSSKNCVRKFLRALHPKWRANVTTIEESKDLTSLSLDELIGNLKVHEMIIKKDFKIVKEKVERKSIALKAKKESSDEECSTSGSEDEEYAMAVRDFKCCDPNHLIGECPKPPKDKNQRAFVGGSWSDSDEKDGQKVKDETCLVAHASSEVCSKSFYFSNENSPIDDLALDKEYDKLCKMSLKIITKNKRLKATRNSLENKLRELKGKLSILEKNKGVDLDYAKCHALKIKNEKLKEESTRLNKFEKSTHCLNEMLSNQKPSGDKLGLGFNLFEASSSGTKEIKFVKAQKKASSDGGPINMICLGVNLEPNEWIKESGCSKHMTRNRKLFSTYKAYIRGNVIFGSNFSGNIIGKGTISNDSLKIDNVEHVDNLGFNLLSIGQIYDNKCRVTFSEHDSEITKDGKVIGRRIRKKGLYVMKLGNKPKDQICLTTIDENSTLWHRRLGHANICLIQSLASKELVRNLPKLKFDQHLYDACKIGKQAHASHKAKNVVSMSRCLELLHMDLFGPSAVRSYEENCYTLVIVDDYSRFTWTRFLKDKTKAFDQFEIFSRKIQNQLGYYQNSKAYIVLNKHTKKVKESLNVTFDETPPPSKASPLVDDDLDEEEAIEVIEKKNLENDIMDEALEIDEIVNIKESRNHLLENVIGNLNQRTLGHNPKTKARLVAQGYNQQEGIDYNETYASVTRLESIRILLAYACALDFKLFQIDVKSAFLNGFINEEVYVAQPPGFIDFKKPDHIYKLKKALYGLKQAPKACNKWSLDELVYGAPLEGPYQTNLPSPDDIISFIREDREGQVTRIRHQEEAKSKNLERIMAQEEVVISLPPPPSMNHLHLISTMMMMMEIIKEPRMQSGNKARNKNGVGKARGKPYVLGEGDVNPDLNIVKGTFLPNDYYAFVLFDSGVDRSFVSTTFSTLLDITPNTLGISYVIELVDGRASKTNTMLRGCTLGLLGHLFNIDLMQVELGSFDVIIDMDWLANHHVVIVCDEKILRIPYGDEVLIVQVTKKETEDKSEEKRLEDVPTVRDFPEVFPEDFPGLPPTRQVEFQIDLVLGAAPLALTPYRLAPSKLKEFSAQLRELSNKGFIRLSSSPWGAPSSGGRHSKDIIYNTLRSLGVLSDAIWTDQRINGIHGSDESEAAFQPLKQKLCSVPILALPEGSENFVVYCDDSRKGLGAVLMQREKFIAYASRQLEIQKKNYTTHYLELKAIVFALKMWRHKFTSHFWKSLNKALGTQLDMSMAYHPQTDGQSKKTIQTLEDMLHACVMDFGKGWDRHLPLCFIDEPLTIPFDEIQIDDELNFIEEPVEIMDQEVKQLKLSLIPIVKVCWNSRRGPEFTWEREDQMKKKYPHLFVNPSSTS